MVERGHLQSRRHAHFAALRKRKWRMEHGGERRWIGQGFFPSLGAVVLLVAAVCVQAGELDPALLAKRLQRWRLDHSQGRLLAEAARRLHLIIGVHAHVPIEAAQLVSLVVAVFAFKNLAVASNFVLRGLV